MNSIRHFRLSKKVFILLTIFALVSASFSQQQSTGEVYGTITDQSSGEKLVGISVTLSGTALGAATDIDGKYNIRKISPGTYELRVFGVGYAAKTITGISITSGSRLEMNVSLGEETYNLHEVVVTADEVRSSENAVLAKRKRSTSISDGISSEQIKRTPDATSGDALKRITGLSIVDNKFVFIRGITDRYNETTLDGASVSSTEVGKKSFSFDLLPANLLDNTSVIKSATPDLPGDFSGGLVQLNTLDFPATGAVKLNLGSSYNSASTSKDFLGTQGGTKDWLGIDDGSRSYPGDQPDGNQIARNAPNNWAPRSKTAPYNGSFSLSMGDRIDFDRDNQSGSQLGFIGALSYKNSYQRNEQTISDYELSRSNTGSKDEYAVLWGALMNVSYKISGLNKISMKNNFNQSGNDRVNRFQGADEQNNTENIYTIINWTQRSSYTGQLIGEHTFPQFGGLTFQWRGAISSSYREDPDKKEVTYYRGLDNNTARFTASTSQRSWSDLRDQQKSFGFDFTFPWLNVKVKAGSFVETKTTDFRIRYFSVEAEYPGAFSLDTLPLDVIYSQDHYGPGKFNFKEISKPSDIYDGDQKLYAGYFMADVPFVLLDNKFRLTGGVRLENVEQNVYVPTTLTVGGSLRRSRVKNIDFLPSMNFAYLFNDAISLRLAYSQSVNRPDLRELASTGFYDFIKAELVKGNPDLQRAYIHNYDVRLEIFPDVGELLAVSYFHKVISNAIEEQLLTAATREREWFNSDHASNSGWEFEFRKSLNFLGGYARNFSVTGNYSRIESQVEVVEVTGNSTNTQYITFTRPLQGQSPYMINLSLLFTEPSIGTSLSILYNKFGARLDAVGFQVADIYEEPRDLVDIAVSQAIFGSLEGKFTIKNLNDKDRILTRGGRLLEQTSSGRTFALQLSLGL